MATAAVQPSDTRFDFNYYRFNGRGQRPTLVASVTEAHFMRSRQPVEESLIDTARTRVEQWCRNAGVSAWMKKPYPSKQYGRFWIDMPPYR